MPWVSPATAVAGSVLTAALLNTYLRDNAIELRAGGIAISGQTAGDIIFAASDTQLGRTSLAALQSIRKNTGNTALEVFYPVKRDADFANPFVQASNGDTIVDFAVLALQAPRMNAGATALEAFYPVKRVTHWVTPGLLYGSGDTAEQFAITAGYVPRMNVGGTALENFRIVGTHELFIPASAFKPRVNSSPCGWHETLSLATSVSDPSALPFDPTSAEFAVLQIALPKAWNEGTITGQFYWTGISGGTTGQGVVWGWYAHCFGDGDNMEAAFSATASVTDALQTNKFMHISAETAAITPGGTPAVNDYLTILVVRSPTDGADTYPSDAYFLGLKLRLVTDAATDD